MIILNTFFSNFVSNLDIPNPCNYFKKEKFYSLPAIIEDFEKHLSNIKSKNFKSIFSFKKPTPEEVVKVIRNLNKLKSCQTTDIPTKVIKLNSEILLY